MTERLVVMSESDLRNMIRTEIAEALVRFVALPSEIITRDEAAEILHVHPQVVTRYVRTRGLVGAKMGRDWRFKRSDVERWLAEQSQKRSA